MGRWAAPGRAAAVRGPCRPSVPSSLRLCAVGVLQETKLGLFLHHSARGRWSPASLEESKGWPTKREGAGITVCWRRGGRWDLLEVPWGFMGRRLVWPPPTPTKGEGMKQDRNSGMNE